MAAFGRRTSPLQVCLIGLLFLGRLIYVAHLEVQYVWQGSIARAVVTEARQYSEHSKSGESHWLALNYQFAEPSGNLRYGSDDIPLTADRPGIGSVINVQFLPGNDGQTRVQNHDHFLETAALLVVLAVVLVVIGFRFAFVRAEAQGNGRFDHVTADRLG